MISLERLAEIEAAPREAHIFKAEAKELTDAYRERDEARAEVERLRALTICGCGDHFAIGFEGTCPNCIAAGKEPKP